MEQEENLDENFEAGDEVEHFSTIEYHGISANKFTKRAVYSDSAVLPKNEIHVSAHSSIAGMCKKIFKLLKFHRSVVLHGLGVAIELAANIAEKLRLDSPGEFVFSTTTSTVPLIDDYTPLEPGLPAFTQVRFNSAIHISIAYTLAQPLTAPPQTTRELKQMTGSQRFNAQAGTARK